MICHVVLYRLRPGADEAKRNQLVNDARTRLANVNGVTNLRVGVNIEPRDASFGVALYMEFDDQAALERYRSDGDHQAFIRDCVEGVVEHTQRYDFVTE